MKYFSDLLFDWFDAIHYIFTIEAALLIEVRGCWDEESVMPSKVVSAAAAAAAVRKPATATGGAGRTAKPSRSTHPGEVEWTTAAVEVVA